MTKRIRRTAAALVAAMAVVVLAGCGSDPAPMTNPEVDPLANRVLSGTPSSTASPTPEPTSDADPDWYRRADPVRVSVDVVQESDSLVVEGDIERTSSTPQASLRLTYLDQTYEFALTGGTLYGKSPSEGWSNLGAVSGFTDPSQASGGQLAALYHQSAQLASADDLDAVLRSSRDITEQGTETIDGRPTTHYAGTSGGGTVEAWVDEEGNLVKGVMTNDGETATWRFSNFDSPITVAVPS